LRSLLLLVFAFAVAAALIRNLDLMAILFIAIVVFAFFVVWWFGPFPFFTDERERHFHRMLRGRRQLSACEFFKTYYSGSEIPQEVVVRLRTMLEDATGYYLGGMHPSDNLVYVDCELDWADVLFRIKRGFDVVVTPDMLNGPEVTFDYLVKCIIGARRCEASLS
jgi:hypothetical protein